MVAKSKYRGRVIIHTPSGWVFEDTKEPITEPVECEVKEVKLGDRILYFGVQNKGDSRSVYEGTLLEVETVGGSEFAKVMNTICARELWIQSFRIIGALPEDGEGIA